VEVFLLDVEGPAGLSLYEHLAEVEALLDPLDTFRFVGQELHPTGFLVRASLPSIA
jgi:hypothetical protein